jgi:c-di-GMP-binding flagellar brake protein YcgR
MDSLDDFRITEPFEIAAVLKRLADGHVQLGLAMPGGRSLVASVWTHDAARGTLSLSLPAHESNLQAIVECDEAMAVGYLDSVKVQFDIDKPVLVRSGNAVALKCAFPRELYRFQRRNGFRVRPLPRATPMALLRHPAIADMRLELRILDISIGGCALFLPSDVPALAAGVLMNGVVLDLDADTRVQTALRLQHVMSLDPHLGGVRLGCEMVAPPMEGQRALQRYIDLTQKRRRLLCIE